jgi:ActR/RegA family two-component response regulator
VRAPTRALVVENIDAWVHILDRAARGAGASEVIICENLQMVRDALRSARFDIAILEVGLDPDDDLNLDGIKALQAIRQVDGGDTRCVLVTGWQSGDRMDMQADAQHKFGVEWAYMKEKYEAHAVIAKLAELLKHAETRRLPQTRPMADLSARVEPILFEGQLLTGLSPCGGIKTLYSLTSELLSSAIPIIAMHPVMPMEKGPNGVWGGLYWSRALATAIAVSLGPAPVYRDEKGNMPTELARLLPTGIVPDLIESVPKYNVYGRLWELRGLDRDKFPG